jgi:hypothetical protein
MAKYQYRINTDSNGTSNFGYAYLALMNPSGSGKRITIRSLEIYLQMMTGAVSTIATLDIGTPANVVGEDMSKCRAVLDSSVAFPAGVSVKRNATYNTNGALTIRRFDLSRRSGAVGNQNRLIMGSPLGIGKRGKRPLCGFYNSIGTGGTLEPITLNYQEVLSLVPIERAVYNTNPIRVSLTLSVNGKTAVYDFNANIYPGTAIFSVVNYESGAVVKLLNLSLIETGTTDTPTLKIVPIGQLYSDDITDTSKKQVSIFKMDSTYPDFAGIAYTDIGFVPSGVPEVAIAPASTGTPQGMNYLHTRDFWGPLYRNMLVELAGNKGAGAAVGDTWGLNYSHYYSDILARRAGITLNQGEGIAIVNSAETAVGVQAAFGGWNPLSFAMQVDVEPAIVPTVTISAQVSLVGSEIRIYDMDNNPTGSLGTELSGTENCPTATFDYVGESGNTIWIQIMKTGYVEFGQSITIPEVSSYGYNVNLQPELSA